MNYSACWRSKKALVSIRCHTFNTWAKRVVIVCSVIARIFNPLQVLGSHISTFFKWHSWFYFVFVYSDRCRLLLYTIVWFIVHLLFDLLFDFCSVLHSMKFFYSIRFYCLVSCSPSKYSVLILDCIPGISIPLNIIIRQVKRHLTADCTVFVLV